MKRLRKMAGSLITAFAICFLFANVLNVQAYTRENKVKDAVYIDAVRNAKGKWVNNTKRRIDTFSIEQIKVEFAVNGTIRNLKSNKKGLEVKQTEYDADAGSHYLYDANSNYIGSFDYGTAEISLYATKAGSYKVTFDVYNQAGVKLKKCTVNILAANDNDVIKTATLGKTKLRTSKATVKNGELTLSKSSINKVSAKSGKLKVTGNAKYKITGLVVSGVNKNGKEYFKKYKNGKNIALSQAYEYSERDANGSSSRTSKKYTYIYVSYKDTFTGDSVTYNVTQKRGKKEVVCTSKNKLTGVTKTTYNDEDSISVITLWNY